MPNLFWINQLEGAATNKQYTDPVTKPLFKSLLKKVVNATHLVTYQGVPRLLHGIKVKPQRWPH